MPGIDDPSGTTRLGTIVNTALRAGIVITIAVAVTGYTSIWLFCQPGTEGSGNGINLLGTPSGRSVATSAPSDQMFEARYEYDGAGSLVGRTDANGATTRYEYDVENRLVRIDYPDDSEVTYAYDDIGRRTRMTDPLGTTSYVYDLRGRLASVTDANGNTVGYEYDLAGNLTTLVYPDDSVVHYDYDADGLMTSVTDQAGTTTYAYDEAGRLVARTLPNQITTRYAYEPGGSLTGVFHVDRAGETLLAFEYTLDMAGRRTQVVETTADGQRQTTQYGYDSLGRLVEVTYPDGRTVRYAYDALGNRLSMVTPEGETVYSYDQANRLLSLTGPDGSVTEYAYDGNGNVVERRSPGGTTRYTYDHDNLLVRVQDGTMVVVHEYDGDGYRVAKTVDGVRTEYVNDVNCMLPHVLVEQGAGNEVRYTQDGRVLAQASAVAGEVVYLLEDGLGSTVALAGEEDTLVTRVSYEGFGLPITGGSADSPYGFTGERYDPETGLLYLRARYYDPGIGRFIGKDPLPGLLRDPQSQNAYVYAENNAANLVDPSGFQPPYPYDRDRQDRMPAYHERWLTPREAVRVYPPPQLSTPPTRAEQALSVIAQESVFSGIGGFLGPGLGGLLSAGTSMWSLWPGTAYDPVLLRYYGHTENIYTALSTSLAFQQVGYIRPVSREDIESARLDIALHMAYYGPRALTDQYVGHLLGGYSGISGFEHWRSIHYSSDSDSDGIPDHLDPAPHDQRTNVFPGDDGDGGGGGAVGGVLLDKSAEVLMNLNDITGAAFDPTTGQLILIGQEDTALPPMSLDDLAVAIRAVYAGEDPGVTMVPVDPSWQDSTQRVEYFGQTDGTHFGLVMFEADRFLKGLASGRDTLTGEPVTPDVQGFKSELELSFELQTDVPWHRNWFVPDQIVLKLAEDGQSMIFERATMRVESRFIQFLEDGTQIDIQGSSPVTDQFTQLISEHYDEFAKEQEELAELIQLAKIVGVVRWLRDNDIPVDFSWMEGYPITPADTPRTTPGISTEVCTTDGTYCVVSFGGVDFQPENAYQEDGDGQVAELREQTLASRPLDLPLTWEFEEGGESYIAVALNLAPAEVVGGYSTALRDLCVGANGGLSVDFTRYYNSLNLEDGAMGPGWSSTPYRLHVQEIAQLDSRTDLGKTYLVEQQMYLVTGNGRERFTGPYIDSSGQRFFVPERGDSDYREIVVHDDGIYTLQLPDGMDIHFHANGGVDAIEDQNGNRVTYRYDGEGRLTGVADAAGLGVTLSYDGGSRLVRATTSDGRSVSYEYDRDGRLVGVADAGGPVASYLYDEENRLIEIQDCDGQTLLQNSYDNLGRLLAQTDGAGYHFTVAYEPTTGQVTYTDAEDNLFIGTYENGNLVDLTDPRGHAAHYSYDEDGRLTAVTDERGNAVHYEYDEQGNLSEIRSPSGATMRVYYDAESRPAWMINPENMMTAFEYDERGNLVQLRVSDDSSQAHTMVEFAYDDRGQCVAVTDARGSTVSIEYDERGNVTAMQMPSGAATQMTYDERARLASVTDPLGSTVYFGYDERDYMTSVTTPAGTVHYDYDQRQNLTSVVGPMGDATNYEYDAMGRLTSVTEPTGVTTRYEYNAAGNLTDIVYSNGAQQHYEYDAIGQLISEIYSVP
jgi:RHS repeat-associated protein